MAGVNLSPAREDVNHQPTARKDTGETTVALTSPELPSIIIMLDICAYND